jgi:hypothetical protein
VSLDVLWLTLSLCGEPKHAPGDLHSGPPTLKGECRTGENFVQNITKHLHGGCVVGHGKIPIIESQKTRVPNSKCASRQRLFSN